MFDLQIESKLSIFRNINDIFADDGHWYGRVPHMVIKAAGYGRKFYYVSSFDQIAI